MNEEKQLSLEEYEICNKLKRMRFSGMAESLEEVFADPNEDLLPFKDKIQRIVDAEWNLRYSKKLNRFIKKATLKYPAADLDDTIYDAERQLDVRIIEELSKCEWIEEGKNLVITGKTSSGKSYLANALSICALRQFKTVRYVKASYLINELSRAEKLDTYQDTLNQFASYDLLVVDDFGLMNMEVNKCRNLFEVFDSRDPHKSILVISQFPVSSWYDMFQDHTYAEACLARLLSGAYRLEMNGKNMRNMEPINK
jgi:DNA replication protein DnaC